jgi:DNA-binding MarR family transcriptional regulator
VNADELERMADGIVRLRAEILRRRDPEADNATGIELTSPQALALRIVATEGPLRMGALAETLGVTVATASRTVDALEASGLVSREPDPADARAVRVVATPEGKREHARRRKRFVDALERLMEELSAEERRQLAESLETLSLLLAPRSPLHR